MNKNNKTPITKTSPEDFIKNTLGVGFLTDEQKSIVDSVWKNKYTGVKSSPNMGKTFIAACIVLAFLYTYENSKVITTAPTARQVEDLLWREIAFLFNNAAEKLNGKLNSTELKIDDKWFAAGISTQVRKEEESAVRMRGYHAEQILVVVDEASGVHNAILEAVEDITSGENSKVLMISNPVTRACGFYKFCKQQDTNVIEMSCFTHPNVLQNKEIVKGAISRSWIRKQISKHCEILNSEMVKLPNDEVMNAETGSNIFTFDGKFYRSNSVGMWRLLAKFPETSTDTLIDYIKIENSMNRITSKGIANQSNEKITIALDVARFGDDQSVFCINDNLNFSFRAYYHFDIARLSGVAIKLIKELKPGKFAVDCDGIGAGVYDNINEAVNSGVFEHEFELVEIHSASEPMDFGQQEQFINKRAQMYWLLRSDIDMISIEKNDELLDGLSSIKYFFNSKGKIQIEEKKNFKSSHGRSPDFEDALAYCNFLRYDESSDMKIFFLREGNI